MNHNISENPDQKWVDELSFYTLSHPDSDYFIHQHVVDAYALQNADSQTKPITLIFALAGLYLLIEKHYTGKQVQRFHLRMAEDKKHWPEIVLPEYRGGVTIRELIGKLPGQERDGMIIQWCRSVWEAYALCHESVKRLVESYK
jgi:hypothetical protein